jgi:hypothetical protein
VVAALVTEAAVPTAPGSPIEQPPLRLTDVHTLPWSIMPGGHVNGIGVWVGGTVGVRLRSQSPVSGLQISAASQSLVFPHGVLMAKGSEHVPT